ncbi:MAG: sugar transferase [Chloroflexi bacterium]|nr:sugar transferase [Chloroflexota bacterium]
MAVKDSYKRWFDISVLVIAHLLLLPMWVILWTVIPVLIWLEDRHTVFYRQQRMGRGGKPFVVIKFRTMVVDADELGPAWTIDDDPRVTRVGRILRRTALDELPEVISIWKGDMSFVGPRALDVDEELALEELMPGFEKRLQVRPGLTGLAQIHDKVDDPHEKFRYDMEYLQSLSPALDAKLMVRSVWNTVGARWDNRSGKTKLEDLMPRRKNGSSDDSKQPEILTPDTEKDVR